MFSAALSPRLARSPAVFAGLLGALSAFAPMSVDMYLPAMPGLVDDFHTGTAQVQLTLSAFLFGFGLGQLFYGPLSDRFGRKPALLIGLTLYLVGTIGCLTTETIGPLAMWRFVQAVGACSGQVLARAMVRDVFDRDRAARMLSVMVLLMGAAPMLAPLIGGQLLHWFDWRAIFWTLIGFGVISLSAVLLALNETLPVERRTRFTPTQMFAAYATVLRHRRLVGYVATTALTYSSIFVYISGSPFVFIEVYGVPKEHFGLLFGANVIGLMIGAFTNSRLVLRYGSDPLLRIGTLAAAMAGCCVALAAITGIGGLIGLSIPLILLMSSLGFVGANSMAGGLSIFPHLAGTTSALFGMIQFVVGALMGSLVGALYNVSAVPMALMIALVTLGGLIVHRRLVR